MLNLYLSGPMSNIQDNNASEFNRVTKILREALSYHIINPLEYPNFDTWEDNLKFDLCFITKMGVSNMIMLPGWELSNGARLERYTAYLLNMKVYEYKQLYGDNFTLNILPNEYMLQDKELEMYDKLTSYDLTNTPIGITGKLHSGKDTIADMLINNNPNRYYKYSFAKPMKTIAHDIFSFTEKQLYDPIEKEKTDLFWDITPRKFLQLLGTDMFRNIFRDDVWIKLTEKQLLNNPEKRCILADVRFNNEAEFVNQQQGILVNVVRDFDDVPKESRVHVSENGVDNKYVNVTIKNNGSLEELAISSVYLETLLTTNVYKHPITLGE